MNFCDFLSFNAGRSHAARKARLRAGVAATLLLIPGAALAADEQAAADPVLSDVAAADAGDEGPIIVTASRRREEAVQDVPIAISVIDASALERRGDFTLGQIQQQVPALQVFSFNPRNTNINIRGLGSNVALTNDGLENGVGFYIDNVYYGRVGLSQFDLVDLEQIEVLRGPQGTLFGKNTTSGVINISSRKPSFDPEFSGEASVGNYGYWQARASASTGLVQDLLAVRLSGAYTKRDGFLLNTATGEEAQDYENASVRGQLLFTPSSDLTIRLIGDYSSQKQNYVLNIFANYVGTYDNGAVIPNNFAARLARLNKAFPTIAPFDRKGESDSHYQSNMNGYGVSGQVDWDLGGAELTAITAYRWWDWNPANDGDSTALPVVTKAQQANRQRQFSQEIRLASQGSNRLNYVVGAYYFWQIIRGYGASAYGPAAAAWNLPAVDPVVGNAALNGFEANSVSTPETRSLALFGQADWEITDRLTLTAGLRYTHEKKEGGFRQYWVAGNDLSGLTPAQQAAATAIRGQFNPLQDFSTKFSSDSLSGLATLRWEVNRDAILYATYSRGNKSGGLNLSALPAGIAPEVAPERVDAYEIGFKSQLFDRKLTLNSALFWTETANYQTAITEQIASTVNYRQYIANIPKVRSRGVEVDAVFAPSRHFSLNASLAYADTTYRDYKNAPQAVERLNISGIQDLSGQQLSGVPKFTYTLGADASAPAPGLGAGTEIYGHVDWSHRSSFNTSASNSRLAVVEGYGLVNGRIGLKFADGKYDLAIWGKNLLDEDYFQTLSAGNTGLVTALIGDPRTYGITLRAKL